MNKKKFNDILDDKLTAKQKQVLKLYFKGNTPDNIAQELQCDASTVRRHLTNVCKAFGLVNEQGERFSFRPELVDLFVKYKPAMVNFDHWESYRPQQKEPEFPGRPISPNSPFYIKRFYSECLSLEERCSHTVLQTGSLIRIRSPKKMGKTSLLNYILNEASQHGYKTVRLNLRQAEEAILDNLDHFLQWFCTNISQCLNLKPRLDDYWSNEKAGSMVSCTTYFQAYLLEQIDTPLILGLDEVDRLFEHEKIAKPFFALLRSWHEDANNLMVWGKLRLVVAYSTQVYIPLNLKQSPFNVGLPIKLPELTLQQVHKLATEYGLTWLRNSQAEQLQAMVGGHPYLIQLALYYLRQQIMSFEQLLQTASTPAGIYSNYLQSIWLTVSDHPELLEALKTLLQVDASVLIDRISAYKLESMGIVQFQENQVNFSCQLYRRYFSSCLGT